MDVFLPAEVIKKKRNGQELTEVEIETFIHQYTHGTIPDYQAAALAMAIYFKGMSDSETLFLTKAMLHSGVTVDLASVAGFKVDKHSTGGVGDKTSLILGPIVAAAGVPVPMISGRGLGHTGGTLDKLESIPGFNTQKTLKEFVELTKKHLICFIGQTKEICPADKKMYALRDVTATIESLPLICASIMSKKLAEGIDGLVLDVKYGSGAFMKSSDEAIELATRLSNIAKGAGKKVTALVTNMNQPLGRFAGNSVEVFECVEIMQNKKFLNEHGTDLYADTRELSLILSAEMLLLAGHKNSYEECFAVAVEMLTSGKAFEKFKELCEIHQGDLGKLPPPQSAHLVKAKTDGFVAELNTELVGVAGIVLKAGRRVSSDVIIPTTGIEFHHKIGDPVKSGDVLFTIYSDSTRDTADAFKLLNHCVTISLQKPQIPSLIFKRV